MNLLLDSLPNSVVVDGFTFKVNTDFRVFIRIEEILNNTEMSSRAKVEEWIRLVFEKPPRNIKAAVDQIMLLYNCGIPPEQKKTQGGIRPKEKLVYDFEFDAPYIYAAFLAQYGIDLTEESLHWWKFIALFKSLTKGNKIVEIMSYRAADPGEIQDENERARIIRLKSIYAIPTAKTLEEKVAQAGAVFGGGLF